MPLQKWTPRHLWKKPYVAVVLHCTACDFHCKAVHVSWERKTFKIVSLDLQHQITFLVSFNILGARGINYSVGVSDEARIRQTLRGDFFFKCARKQMIFSSSANPEKIPSNRNRIFACLDGSFHGSREPCRFPFTPFPYARNGCLRMTLKSTEPCRRMCSGFLTWDYCSLSARPDGLDDQTPPQSWFGAPAVLWSVFYCR